MRIAVVQQGDPTAPSSWSGTPSGLIAGLRGNDCDVVPIDARFRGSDRVASLLRLSWAQQEANRVFAALVGRTANRGLAAAGSLDGVVTVGSSFLLSTDLPTVTFEDMTVAQALAVAPERLPVGKAAARRWVERQGRIYERSVGCCVASEWAAQSVRDDYDVPAERVHVVGFGTLMPTVAAGKRDWSVPRYLFAGFDWERKGGTALVTAFAEVRKRFPDAHLDLVGGHPPVSAPGVTAHGPLPLGSESGQARYLELLSAATCFVMPSALEPFGMAYVDAARTGIASIGTTVGGAPDAIGDGGVLVEPGDHDALVAAMLKLADPEVARSLGARAEAHAAGFTWDAVGARVLAALRG
jgi:glycosyltransferase involved in cell wall biosynthesis